MLSVLLQTLYSSHSLASPRPCINVVLSFSAKQAAAATGRHAALRYAPRPATAAAGRTSLSHGSSPSPASQLLLRRQRLEPLGCQLILTSPAPSHPPPAPHACGRGQPLGHIECNAAFIIVQVCAAQEAALAVALSTARYTWTWRAGQQPQCRFLLPAGAAALALHIPTELLCKG